jgi:transcriptional regulator with XRE-family HTH domain
MSIIIFNRIKSVIAEKGVTSEWLAEEGNWNRATVSKWCTNRTQPTIENLFQIAALLDCTPGELLLPKAETRSASRSGAKTDLRPGATRKAGEKKK